MIMKRPIRRRPEISERMGLLQYADVELNPSVMINLRQALSSSPGTLPAIKQHALATSRCEASFADLVEGRVLRHSSAATLWETPFLTKIRSCLRLALSKSSSRPKDEIISYRHGNVPFSVSTNPILCAPELEISGQHLDKARCFK